MITDELKQGDILGTDLHNEKCRYFITLTPDCDIYNNKFRSIITVLPVIRVIDYVESVFLRRK